MAKKIIQANEVVAFEVDETQVTHAAEFIKKDEIKIGDKYIHLLGANRQLHEVVDIVGGPGAPGGTLVFLKIATRPRIGDQLFITATPKILDAYFRKHVPGRPPTGPLEPNQPEVE